MWTNGVCVRGEYGAAAIAVDSSDNVFVTGDIGGLVAYSGGGVPLWTNRGVLLGNAIAVDNRGNVFVTGRSSLGYGTIAYSGGGIPL